MADNDNDPEPDREVRHQGASPDDRRVMPPLFLNIAIRSRPYNPTKATETLAFWARPALRKQGNNSGGTAGITAGVSGTKEQPATL
jgi:hypothetical protein